jgi:hypothetical protein
MLIQDTAQVVIATTFNTWRTKLEAFPAAALSDGRDKVAVRGG